MIMCLYGRERAGGQFRQRREGVLYEYGVPSSMVDSHSVFRLESEELR